MVSILSESLQRRLEMPTEEPLGQALARELLSLENVAYLMANGERNGLPVPPDQLIYQEKAVAVGEETVSVPTLILYSQDERSDTLTPLITCHLLVTPEGAMELAHIVVTQSTLTDACETLPRMRKEDERVPITKLDIDFARDTVVYRARLSAQPRTIIPTSTAFL